MPRFMALADETMFGTPAGTPQTYLSAIRTDLGPEREAMDIKSMAILGYEDSRVGTYKCTGDVELVPSSENFYKLLKWLMGAGITSTQDGSNLRWKHVFVPSSTLKFGTIWIYPELGITPTDKILRYTSCIPLELRLEGAVNAPASCVFSMLGQKDAAVDAFSMGALPTIRQFFSIDAKVYMPFATEVSAKVDSLSLTIARAVPDDYFAMTDAFLQGYLGGDFTLEGSMDLLFKDLDALKLFWGGDTGPIKSPAETSLKIEFIGPVLGGVSDYANHLFRIEAPKVILPNAKAPIEQMTKIIQTVPFHCFRGSIAGGTHVCAITLCNTIAGGSI